MTSHQAREQMLGYLYQVRYALLLLLQNDDEQAQISIEKFDDIAFVADDNPRFNPLIMENIRVSQALL